MEISNYKNGDEHKIIALFEEVFNQKFALESWYWRFKNNPAGNYKIKLMWDGDKLIGHYAVSPIVLESFGQLINTAHSLATMTHPEYTGKGIFKLLANELYNELSAEGFQAVWGFPNNNSHYTFIKSLNWKNITSLHTLSIDVNSIKTNEEFSQIIVKEYHVFDDLDVVFIKNKTKDFHVKVDRNLAYLNWRYIDKPSVKYRKFNIFKNSELIGLVVTKIYPSNIEGYYDLNIVESFLDDYSNFHSTISSILRTYDLKFKRVTLWKNLFDVDHLNLERIGFTPALPITYIGLMGLPSLDVANFNTNNWYFSQGDSDIY